MVALVLVSAIVGQAGTALAAGTKLSAAPKQKTGSEPQEAQPGADLVAAKQAYQEALRSFNLGQWDEAVAGFQKSYKLSGDAALLFNVAQAQRQAGHIKEAIVAYKAFLRERPETPNRKTIEAKIKDLESAAEAKTAAEKLPAAPAQPDRLTGIWEDPFAPKSGSPPAVADGMATPSTPGPAPLVPPSASASPPTPNVPPIAPVERTPVTEPVLAASPPAADIGKPAAQQPALDLRQEIPRQEASAVSASSSHWWLWTGIAVVVAAGATTAVLLLTRSPGRDGTCPSGLDGCIPVGK